MKIVSGNISWKPISLAIIVLIAAAGLALSGDGVGKSSRTDKTSSMNVTLSEADADSAADGAPYTLRFFTNNSERTVGQGWMEQELIDRYMREHPNVTIEVETLSPDPQFQDKIKVYNASNELPDIIAAWGNRNFLKPLVDSGSIAEIDTNLIADCGFVERALDGFRFNGKLYGFPRNSDFWVLYYNKQLFADLHIPVPAKESELRDAARKLQANNIVPIAMDGRDAWPSGIWFETMLEREAGTWDIARHAMDGSGSFNDPLVVAAAQAMKNWIDAGLFGTGFLNQDYAAARSLFGQGRAAMFMTGEWEMGMAADESFPRDVRDNIGAIPLPLLDGGKGSASDLTAWFGGGYAVSAKSPHRAEATKFLAWMFQPENWAKGAWQNGVAFPAQKVDRFLTGTETPLQQNLRMIYDSARSYSGTVSQDKFSADTQKLFYDSLQELESGMLSKEAFSRAIADAARASYEMEEPEK